MVRRHLTAGWVMAIMAVAVLAGAFPLPMLTGAVIGGGAFGLVRWAGFRLLWLLLGAIFVFQTDAGLSTSKLVYLAGVVVAVGIAARRLPRLLKQPWAHRFKPAVVGAAALAGWVMFPGLIYALAVAGSGFQNYARDALTYLLISAAVVIGIDAASQLTVKAVRLMLIAVGGIAAYGFASAWIARRGFSGTPSDQLNQAFFASMAALIVPLALALTFGLTPKIKVWWLAYAAALFLAVLVTGARTGLALAAIVAGLVGARSRARVSIRRCVAGAVLVIAAVGFTLPLVSSQFTSETFGASRLHQAIIAITQGVSQDQSGALRERAYVITLSVFQFHPIMGQGLGQTFESPGVDAGGRGLTLDSPFVVLAKFGILGALILLAAIGAIAYSCTRRASTVQSLREATVARGAVAAWVALLPFGFVTEDKGFALSIAMMVTLVGAAARAAQIPEIRDSTGQTIAASGVAELVAR